MHVRKKRGSLKGDEKTLCKLNLHEKRIGGKVTTE
jgi:hypothetical protein